MLSLFSRGSLESQPSRPSWLATTLLIAAVGGASWVPGPARAVPPRDAAAPGCGPFDAPRTFAQLGPSQEPGIAPASPNAANAPAVPDGGQIVDLPGHGSDVPPSQVAGEAILALPKGPDGKLPEDFELSPHARVAESFFSPVLCATLARITGRAEDRPEDLVPKLPDTAALVPNHIYRTADAEIVPLAGDAAPPRPDPYRDLQWALDVARVEQARLVSQGAGVRVAILDSAPQTDHRDLGPIEVARVEDGPGDAPGAHGTLVTGIIDAVTDNGFGIAGLAPGATIVAVPVCTPEGASASDACPLFTVLRGLDRAWEAKVSLVNLSIVGPENPLLARGMERLDVLGVVVVAAAGNEGTGEPRYPAAYPSVVGVGAMDREGLMYARSNRGASAELLAPGVEVLSSVPGSAFAFGSGTSFAAAHVTGTLALVVGAGVPPEAARTALFQQANARPGKSLQPPVVPAVCEVLARAGRPCPE